MNGKRKDGGINMSFYLRRVMEKLQADGWDLSTVPTKEIIAKAKSLVRGRDKTETYELKAAFEPTPAQVSIVKRSLTGGHGKVVGRPVLSEA